MLGVSVTKINKLIPKAAELIQEGEFSLLKGGKIPNSFKGYVSSYGANVVMSGSFLSATLAFENSSGSKEEKEKVTSIILKLIPPGHDCSSLSKYIIKHTNAGEFKETAKSEIVHAAIALKQAMKLFKFDENSNENN